MEPRVYPNLEAVVSAVGPITPFFIAAGGSHVACNIQINKPICIIGGGNLPDDTVLTCSRGFDK
ncbi:F-box protein SKIP5 [Zea mays]|uniref:F-box protein SKIP5 n=1 Tax=Zea mays TaxID=4577 RepID=A0A1D6F344_MAIZE|nr:F-box protein SKIP5 [Zea mays]